MGLIKPTKTIKPFRTANFSQSFDDGRLETTTDLTNLIVDNQDWLILLNRENYLINTNAICTAKYIKGVLSNSKYSQGYYPTIHLQQPLKISGTWIFENVYIFGNAIQLQSGAKLILRNCFLYFSSNVSFICIDASNGSLLIENSIVKIEPIGGASIRVVFGSDVQIYNSQIDRFTFGQQTGNLQAENSNLSAWDGSPMLNGYNINLINSSIEGFNHSGTINLNAYNSWLGRTLSYAGTRGISGKVIHCRLNSMILSNTSSTLKFYNCVFLKESNDTWSGVISINGGNPIIEVFNSTLINAISNQYVLYCNNSSAIVKLVNSTFKSTLGRFIKSGSGTNNILTINCVGNKDVATDSGFNTGEINDVSFVYSGNF